MNKVLLQADPPADIHVALAWIHMLPLDNAITAGCLARTIRDPRVHHFDDPQKRAGAAVATSLGATGKVAWDIYLFYPPGSRWQNGLPAPAAWAHQLQGSSWADPLHYNHGEDLVRQLTIGLAALRRGKAEKT